MRGLHDDLLFYTHVVLYGFRLDGRRRLRRILTDGAGGRCGDSAGCFAGLRAITDGNQNKEHQAAKQQGHEFLRLEFSHRTYNLVVRYFGARQGRRV